MRVWHCEATALGLPAVACDPERPHGAPCGWIEAPEADHVSAERVTVNDVSEALNAAGVGEVAWVTKGISFAGVHPESIVVILNRDDARRFVAALAGLTSRGMTLLRASLERRDRMVNAGMPLRPLRTRSRNRTNRPRTMRRLMVRCRWMVSRDRVGVACWCCARRVRCGLPGLLPTGTT